MTISLLTQVLTEPGSLGEQAGAQRIKSGEKDILPEREAESFAKVLLGKPKADHDQLAEIVDEIVIDVDRDVQEADLEPKPTFDDGAVEQSVPEHSSREASQPDNVIVRGSKTVEIPPLPKDPGTPDVDAENDDRTEVADPVLALPIDGAPKKAPDAVDITPNKIQHQRQAAVFPAPDKTSNVAPRRSESMNSFVPAEQKVLSNSTAPVASTAPSTDAQWATNQGIVEEQIKTFVQPAKPEQDVRTVPSQLAPIQPAPMAAATKRTLKQEKIEVGKLEIGRVEARVEERSRGNTLQPAANMAAPTGFVQNAAAAPVVAAAQTELMKIHAGKLDTNLKLDGELEYVKLDAGLASTSTSYGANATTSLTPRADIPRMIAAQISEFARSMPDKPIEVALNPSELGRVRLSVSASESGVVLNILAERPETLDLMRRHADMLAKELSDLGFASIDLAFGQGQGSEQKDAESSSNETPTMHHSETSNSETKIELTVQAGSQQSAAEGGLDIRI